MKKIFIIMAVISLVFQFFQPNKGLAQNQDNFYTITSKWDTFYNAHPELKDSDDSEYLSYLRWKYFWQDRVYSSDTTQNGSFNLIRNALDNFQNNYNYYHRSTSLYSDWRFIGPQGFDNSHQIAGLVSAVYVDTVNDNSMNTIYIGTNSSGIWKTSDGGANWVNITDNTGYSIIGIHDICGDPTDGNILYAATGGGFMDRNHGYGVGILKSPDKGATWSRVFPNQAWPPYSTLDVFKLKVDPTNTQRIYALADTMVVRTLDGGNTWQKIFGTTRCSFDPDGLNHLNLRDIEMKPNDPTVLYVASDHRTPFNRHQAEVWKLWNVTDTSLGNINSIRLDISFPRSGLVSDYLHSIYTERYAIAVTPADPEAIYVACTAFPYNLDTNQFTIFKYENNQWVRKYHYNWDSQTINDYFGGCGFFKLELLVSPTEHNVVYVGGNTFDKIVDWRFPPINHTPYSYGLNGYHADTRFATILKGSVSPDTTGKKDVIFAGNDGGISKSINGIQDWINLNGNGLYITQFYGIGGCNKNPYWIGGGAQDNNFFVLSTSDHWLQTGGGDMGNAVVNPHNPSRIYSTTWGGGSIQLISDNNYGLNKSWSGPSFNNPTNVYAINAPVCLNPKNPSEVYFATHDLYRSAHDANYNSFATIPIQGNPPLNISSAQAARAMVIAPSDTQRIYIAFNQPYGVFYKSRLFVTNDGGLNWSDRDFSLNITGLYGITSIVVSPTNADSIWISFGGFMNPASGPSNQVRVFVSANAGATWTNYSKGLPNMPVDCLKYKKGSQDGIFAGTDVGVYYIDRTFSDTTWVPLNSSLPESIINDIEFIDTLNVLRIATFGRGIWETDLFPCTYHDNDPLIVSTNQTWLTDTIMDRDIDIKDSTVLQIKCKVRFPINAKITVEQGAQLIVDGGVLTNYCSGMWKGIEVWGDTSKNQIPMYQGNTSFLHGAVIENARIAVTTCKKDANGDIIWSTPGGMVNASNSTFKNNYKALEFLQYSRNQNCAFANVDFQSSGYFVDHTSKLSDFVSIFKSNGIHFYGCSFQNLNFSDYDTSSQDCRGIYSIDGSYSVDGYCASKQTPCTKWKPSDFEGLSYGIKALGTMPIFPIYVTKSKFYKDHRGIYISGINNVAINKDTFEFNPEFYYPPINVDTLYGLYLDNCTGYSVQENKLFKDPNVYNFRYIGMIINNSGPDPNEIYNNNISGVTHAILAQMQNRDSTGQTGLCLKCNDYSQTLYDEVVTNNKWGQYSILYGLAINQGGSTIPAGNTFSVHNPNNKTYDILNTVTNAVNYYYNDPYTTNLKVYPAEVSQDVYRINTHIRYAKDTTCPSKLNNGGTGKDALKQQLLAEQTQIDSLKTVLSSLIDGGSTSTLNTQVQSSIPPEAVQLHQDLLSKSPYLSDTVVKSSIFKENVLPNEMIRDVLIANPASTKSENVIDQLNQRINPMPDSLMAQILASKDSIAAKEILQSKITNHSLKKAYALNELIRYFRNDTISPSPKDSIIGLLQNDPSLESKYKLAFEFFGKQDLESVHSVLTSIPNFFNVKGQDSILYQNYCSYFNILLYLKSQNKSILELNSDQKSTLMNIVSYGKEPAQTYARNVLIANKILDYCEPIILPQDEIKSQTIPKSLKTSKLVQDKYIKLFPNPAKQYFTIEYNLHSKFGENPEIEFSVFSSEGKPLITKSAHKNQDQVLIETRNFENGTYICSMIINGKIIDSGKILIIQ